MYDALVFTNILDNREKPQIRVFTRKHVLFYRRQDALLGNPLSFTHSARVFAAARDTSTQLGVAEAAREVGRHLFQVLSLTGVQVRPDDRQRPENVGKVCHWRVKNRFTGRCGFG